MISRFYARSGFWLAYTSHTRSALTLMTPEFREFVGKRCTNGCLALHCRRDEFTELVARWKAHFPQLKILRYAKIQLINQSPLVGASFYPEAYERRYDWCILRNPRPPNESAPQPREDRDGFLWMDITNSDFRAAVVQHLVKEVKDSGCDGLAIDSHHWELRDPSNIVNGDVLNANWQTGARSVLQQLRTALGPERIVMFNGLWGFNGEEQAIEQGEMLASADGIAVEFFGVDGKNMVDHEDYNPVAEWQRYVGNLNAQLAAVAGGKYAVINGQRLSGVYADYADDYAAALYCYANFLLGPLDPKHGFHAGNFQCAKTLGERTGGYDYFDFQELRLGRPINDIVKATPNGKARAFEDGIVLVAPTAGGTQTFLLAHAYFRMNGQAVSAGPRTLGAGTAEILLTTQPPAPPAALVIAGPASVPSPLTERMVQPVKSGWHRYTVLNLQVRSVDVGSAILVRVEIDNPLTDGDPITHGIVVVRPAGGTFTRTNHDYPYAEPPYGGATNVYAAATYATNNAWHQLAVNLDEAMARPCHRVVSIRAVGNVQVLLMTLSGIAAV
jgi:hypothetical protein